MLSPWVWTTISIVAEILALGAIVHILLRHREPRGMLAWILVLFFLPLLGFILFMLFGEPRRRRHRRRRNRSIRRLAMQAGVDVETVERFSYRAADARPEIRSLIRMTEQLGSPPPTHGNEVTIYHDAEQTFEALFQAIAEAQRYIHLEYYIYQPDDTGRAVAKLLREAVGRGVECRLLLDYVGCWRMPRSFVREMRQAGLEVAWALPMVPLRGRLRVNYRNHRKIAVIDGRIGFTGSQNIGDEYRGRRARFGPWRDTHMRIIGPAVYHMQTIFAADWHYTTHRSLLNPAYLPTPEPAGPHNVQVVPSGPDRNVALMHQLLFAAVSAAHHSVCVITPYFVPDRAMILALTSAAYRGVRVRLIIPDCTDHRVVLWAGRSFYDELIEAGVEIYEHDRAMLHSKVMIVDESWAMVGSANFDERSFLLNFEITTLLYSRDLAAQLQHDFESLRQRSRRIPANPFARCSPLVAMKLGMARLASPLL